MLRFKSYTLKKIAHAVIQVKLVKKWFNKTMPADTREEQRI